ncbi:hypothetical protein HAX54_047454, partial [Datura stramonium]|nr:hypothetical protein [Datura stramonium]
MTATTWGIPLQRDCYHGRRPAVIDKESNRWIHNGGVLTAIAGSLQQKCDRCNGRRE